MTFLKMKGTKIIKDSIYFEYTKDDPNNIEKKSR